MNKPEFKEGIFLPKLNKTFYNLRTMMNHAIRYSKLYKDSQEVFHDAYPDYVIPRCIYCNNEGRWISFVDGYLNVCSNCKKHHTKIIQSNAAKQRIRDKKSGKDKEFECYVKTNVDFYRERILENKPYFDNYFNKIVNEPSMLLRDWCSFGSKLYEERTCIVSEDVYKVNVLRTYPNSSDNLISPNKKYRMLRLIPYDELMQFKEDKNKFKTSKTKEKIKIFEYYKEKNPRLAKFLCSKEEYNDIRSLSKGHAVLFNDRMIYKVSNSAYSITKSFTTEEIVNVLGIDDYISKCVICHKDYLSYKVLNFDPVSNQYIKSKHKAKYTCSKNCYMELINKHKTDVYPIKDETREKLSKKLKSKIASGKFTPNITNSRCRSRIVSSCGSFKFRSTWELAFYLIMQIKFGIFLEYETIRIPYEYNGTKHTYISDFYDKDNKIVYEVKPLSQTTNPKTVCKEMSAKEWCYNRGMKYLFITEEFLKVHLNDDIIERMHLDYNLTLDQVNSRMKYIIGNCVS